jgi:hypothetical protein
MLVLAYLALLFVVLTPGVLLRIPSGGSKLVVAATHGVVLALVWHLTHKAVRRAVEGFASGAGASCSMNGDCVSNKCENNKCM